MAKLTLGDSSFVTSPERDRLAQLRSRYMEVGLAHRRKFLAGYAAFRTADELFEQFPSEIETAISEAVDMAASDIAGHGVYDISVATIRADLDERVVSVQEGFEAVHDKYFDILGKAAELEAQRREAADNRGQIIGGGFGVEGAAKGMAMAAVANAAIGLTYGLANLTANAATALGDKKRKRELLNDPDTKAALADFLCRAILQGYKLVASSVNQAKGAMIFDVVPDEVRQKSTAIAENVTSGRVPESASASVLIQALELDPFNDKAWRFWIDQFGDNDGSVANSAKALGVAAVDAHKSKLIAERKSKLDWSSPEACRASANGLEGYAASLGFPFEDERGRIEALAKDLDKARRTFNGVVYETVADVTAARAAHEDTINRTVDGVVYQSIEDADDERNYQRSLAIEASQAFDTVGWMVLAFRRFRDTSGRSSRKEFWMFILLFLIVAIALTFTSIFIPENVRLIPSLIMLVFLIASFVACLTLQIRRFQDINLSGGFVLLNLIPYLGSAVVLLMMMIDGTQGDNRFGPDPKQRS